MVRNIPRRAEKGIEDVLIFIIIKRMQRRRAEYRVSLGPTVVRVFLFTERVL